MLNRMDIQFPNGKNMKSVDFYGYIVFSNGKVLNKNKSSYLKPSKAGVYTFYIYQNVYKINKQSLQNRIFNTDKNVPLVYPDGRNLDCVIFYDYIVSRDGTVINLCNGKILKPYGQNVTFRMIINGKKKCISGKNLIYNIFSGPTHKKGMKIITINGNKHDLSYENLLPIKKENVYNYVAPKKLLSKAQCEEIRNEYGPLCDKNVRKVAKSDHHTYLKRASYDSIALKYNVSKSVIQRVVNGKY